MGTERSKNFKTPGIDEISIELIKEGGRLVQQNILKLKSLLFRRSNTRGVG